MTSSLVRVVIALIALAALCSSSVEAETWQVRYVRGPIPLHQNARLVLVVHEEELALRDGEKVIMRIPKAAVNRIIHTTVPFSRREQAFRWLPDSLGTGSGDAAVGAVMLGALTWALTSPMQPGHTHYVIFKWTEDNVKQEMMLEASKNDYAAVMDALQRFSGVEWFDLEKEASRVRAELDKSKSNSYPFLLDRTVAVAQWTLFPGPYRALLLQGSDDQNDLYLFAGETVDLQELKAIVPVELSDAQDEAADVTYASSGESVTISSIRLGTKIAKIER